MKHMDTLQKRLIAVLAVLTCIAVFMAFSMYRAIYVNPGSLNTTALSWKNRDIPADMNDVSLVYFTDLEYGRYETHERAQKVFDRIQNMNPRVLIFGGDLFEADAEVTEEMKNQRIQWLSSIPAPLGKFAVLGEQDLVSPERLDLVRQIFTASQVEVIDNSSRLICNRTTAGIRLVGISPQEDWQAALQGVHPDQYTACKPLHRSLRQRSPGIRRHRLCPGRQQPRHPDHLSHPRRVQKLAGIRNRQPLRNHQNRLSLLHLHRHRLHQSQCPAQCHTGNRIHSHQRLKPRQPACIKVRYSTGLFSPLFDNSLTRFYTDSVGQGRHPAEMCTAQSLRT